MDNHPGDVYKRQPYMRGILGQYVFAIPELNAVVVRLGHKRSDTRSAQHYPDDINTWLGAAVEMIQEMCIRDRVPSLGLGLILLGAH